MTREELQTELAENGEWLLQLRAEKQRIEDQILGLCFRNEDIREQLASFRPTLRVVA